MTTASLPSVQLQALRLNRREDRNADRQERNRATIKAATASYDGTMQIVLEAWRTLGIKGLPGAARDSVTAIIEAARTQARHAREIEAIEQEDVKADEDEANEIRLERDSITRSRKEGRR